MITISYEVLKGLIKEYILINHNVVIDDTYTIDFNGTEVEISKSRCESYEATKINFVIGDATKMFNKSLQG